jgi:hypothetical protein
MLNPKLAKKYKIEGSPTIKLFVNQTVIGYAGKNINNHRQLF